MVGNQTAVALISTNAEPNVLLQRPVPRLSGDGPIPAAVGKAVSPQKLCFKTNLMTVTLYTKK